MKTTLLGEILVSDSGNTGLIVYDNLKDRVVIEFNDGWLTLVFRKGVDYKQVMRKDYSFVGLSI